MKPNLIANPKLIDILEELKQREPIFHRLKFGITYADIEDMIDTEFWEVGASGKKYSKEEVNTFCASLCLNCLRSQIVILKLHISSELFGT